MTFHAKRYCASITYYHRQNIQNKRNEVNAIKARNKFMMIQHYFSTNHRTVDSAHDIYHTKEVVSHIQIKKTLINIETHINLLLLFCK